MARQLTINQKQFDADYAGVGYRGWLKAQIHDARPLSEIAPDVEGGGVIEYDDNGTHKKFENYTKLMRIERIDEMAVVIMLECTDTEVLDDD